MKVSSNSDIKYCCDKLRDVFGGITTAPRFGNRGRTSDGTGHFSRPTIGQFPLCHCPFCGIKINISGLKTMQLQDDCCVNVEDFIRAVKVLNIGTTRRELIAKANIFIYCPACGEKIETKE